MTDTQSQLREHCEMIAKQIVESHWWNDSAKVSYSLDGMGLDEALSELWMHN
jgi:hypothetical protein